MGATRAVFFDVDFTLIYPGPTFQAQGYHAFCARHGMTADASRFARAVAAASVVLDEAGHPRPFGDPQDPSAERLRSIVVARQAA